MEEENIVSEGDSVSNGTLFLVKSHTYSEVIRCNNRIKFVSKSEVGRNVWRFIVRLGVVSGMEDRDSIKILEDMERMDRLEEKGKKELHSKLP